MNKGSMLGKYSKAKKKWSPHVAVSQCGRIITGQNEASAEDLADKLVEVLKRQCVNIINEYESGEKKSVVDAKSGESIEGKRKAKSKETNSKASSSSFAKESHTSNFSCQALLVGGEVETK